MAKFLTLAQLVQTSETMLRSLLELGRTRVLEPVTRIAEEAKSIADSIRRDADEGRFDGQQGTPGQDGEPGEPGQDGESPLVDIEEVEDGYRLTITDAEGEHSCTIRHGEPGEPGGVTTVNGRNGAVTLSASDVGARPASWFPELPNRNLLDNPWFTVNQRGSAALPAANGAYHADRWRAWGTQSGAADGVIGINGIRINAGTIYQPMEPELWNSLRGKTLTASIKLPNGNLYSGSVAAFSGETTSFPGFAPINLQISLVHNTNTDACTFEIHKLDGTAYTIRAAKLEIGGVSTLAQDAFPDYASELARCQRYFWGTTNYSHTFRAALISGNDLYTSITLPVPMRAAPSLVNAAGIEVRTLASTAISGFTITLQGGTDGILRIRASKTGHGLADGYFSVAAAQFTADL